MYLGFLGFGFRGFSGFWVLGFWVLGLGFGFRVQGLGFGEIWGRNGKDRGSSLYLAGILTIWAPYSNWRPKKGTLLQRPTLYLDPPSTLCSTLNTLNLGPYTPTWGYLEGPDMCCYIIVVIIFIVSLFVVVLLIFTAFIFFCVCFFFWGGGVGGPEDGKELEELRFLMIGVLGLHHGVGFRN